MFTGLIRELAKVISFKNDILTLNAKHKPKIGDSIAVNGVCLTVIDIAKNQFSVELSKETQKIVAIENYKNLVHIEPAMRATDRFEGHIVQGHIDSIGIIKKIVKDKKGSDFYIAIDKKFIKYIIPKGSIAIDGVSLTINEVFEDSFRLTIINHTLNNTLFKDYTLNTRVNIETDMFARYLYHMFNKNSLSWNEIDSILYRNW